MYLKKYLIQVNVFENAEEDSTSQKKLKHSPSLMKSNSLRSNSSTLSKVSDKEAPLQRKAKKTLTKVLIIFKMVLYKITHEYFKRYGSLLVLT